MDNYDPTLRLYSHSYRWSSKPGKIRCTLTRKQKVKINHRVRNEYLHPVSSILRCLFPGFTCTVWVRMLVTLGATSYLSVQPTSTSILPRTSSLPISTSQRIVSRSKERHRSNLDGLFPPSNEHPGTASREILSPTKGDPELNYISTVTINTDPQE